MKKTVYWTLAIVITLALSVYQRITGPTHPKKVTIELNGQQYKMKLPRSGVRTDEIITLSDVPAEANAQIHYRRYPSNDDFSTKAFTWQDSTWQVTLPVQPVAGKLQYYITVNNHNYPSDEPLVIRFRNDVPAYILVPHILLMFAAMLFAVYTLLLVITQQKYKRWLKLTTLTLFAGGFILGPMVQHEAFGPWWAGFPFDTDLTDNKTLISFLFFLLALATRKWKYNRWVVALAVMVMIAVFTIPHSTNGSEYNYETQQLTTGSN